MRYNRVVTIPQLDCVNMPGMPRAASSRIPPPAPAPAPKPAVIALAHPIDALLSAHGLRRTANARRVLGWLLAHPDTSYTHAQLQAALVGEAVAAVPQLDRVTLYRLIDRLTQAGLLLCRVDASRVRRYQAMPASVRAMPHFECQSCHRDSPLAGALNTRGDDLERAAQAAIDALQLLGYRGMSLDVAVRGVCADCATGAAA
jgi:Fur family transcriptional regulator, ferric uptake regulator